MLQWNLQSHSKHIINKANVAIKNGKKKKNWKLEEVGVSP
jgi:hypothetical protein